MNQPTETPAAASPDKVVPAPTPPARSWYAVRAASADSAELMIYDAIGLWGISADRFVRDLKAIKAKTINLHLNTPGGSVFDGIAIYNALRAHPAKVVAHVDGLAASIGSVVALAGDEVRIAKNAYFMIHNPSMSAGGGAAEMRKAANLLEKVGATIAQTYADKTGKPLDEVQKKMDEETWFTAEEAVDFGLATVVSEVGQEGATAQLAAFDLAKFERVPEAFRAMIAGAGRTDNEKVVQTGGSGPAGGTPHLVSAENRPEKEQKMSQTQTAAGANPAPASASTQAAADTGPKPATIAELKAAFPNDPAYALEAAEKAFTLVEAKAGYADVLAKRLEASQKENEQLKTSAAQKPAEQPKAEEPAARKPGVKPVESKPAEGKSTGASVDAKAEFASRVNALVKDGKSRDTAVSQVVRDDPALHQQVIDQANRK